ncbi:fungal-specific transcription factor domain-containing protein [Parasitella parasitica]|nr:fungal-specific transcription factor domain-containing protein [Parasitella parasitica]
MDENGQVRYLGKSSGYYLLQNSRTYQNGAFHFANYGNRPRNRKRNRSENVDPLELPPKDLSEHLIRLYFKHFYPFLPLFYKRQLFSTIDHPTIEPVAPLLLNAIYAVASRISPDVRVRSNPASPDTAGDIFFERAEKLLDESYDTPSISTVQALLLLASHQHGAMKSARAWLYSGMAFRMAQDLGLHRNCDHWNIPADECERRKRVFWCCYVVDRLASAMYGRASTLEERDCDVPFPTVDDDNLISEDDPNASVSQSSSFRLLEAFTNLIKICDILGHVLKNIYYVRSLQYTGAKQADSVLTTWNKKLKQWYDHLPDSLQIKKDSSSINHTLPPTAVCQLHMIYHTTVILLHRPFIPGPSQSLLPSMLPCASICSAAADAILSITNTMLAENKLRYVMNYAVYYIFTSGIIFIRTACATKPDTRSLLSSDDKTLEAKVKVTKCMQALDEIEATWTTASKSCQILAELSGFRDCDFQGSFQQQHHNVNPWQQQQQQPVSHMRQQHHSAPSHLRPISPQSSESSPQMQFEQHRRTNSSNLRFPIIRVDSSADDVKQSPLYTSSPPSSSALNMDFATHNPFQVKNTGPVSNATAMDPFAAPGIIPVPYPRQYDPLGNAFWGVPSSLDVNEWNSFMNSNLNGQQQQQHDPFANSDNTCLQDRQVYETPSSNAMPSNYQQSAGEKQRLIHTDQHVDVLSGVSVPLDQSPHNNNNNNSNNNNNNSTLMSYLPQLQNDDPQNTTANSNNTSNENKQPPVSNGADLANAYYW